ncbi:MAG: zf-HC2 domain-containing protein [Acidobacteria bacterium]|nr:zf-HC2 domain-containing protein [Acidobacteriota bacterium]MCL5287760.1 zf-HC2 domain-containing protein [Acidobacteriota bacterium]
MNCEKFEARLLAYMDGRATEAERGEVELHLVACAECRARVEEFRRLWGVLDEAPAHEVSPAFDARLRARIAAEPRPTLLGWLLPQPRLALAMSLLLAMGAWISMIPPAQNPNEVARSEEEFRMIKDLQVLEDLDVLANFEALSEVPPAKQTEQRKM